ncbi:hypothetical protein [Algibacillus agarilyticus]|uniref:hypothetical protein n=1 Tax=Algibacillus agarilyticus TaxID=2234133 RepID=UPI000DD0D8E6|nr:hypothetical protein [Algibacillus agarilyticus]
MKKIILASLFSLMSLTANADVVSDLASGLSVEQIIQNAGENLTPTALDALITEIIAADPDLAGEVITAVIAAYPSNDLSGLISLVVSLAPDQAEAIISAAVIASPENAQAIVDIAVANGVDGDAAIVAAILGGADATQISAPTAAGNPNANENAAGNQNANPNAANPNQGQGPAVPNVPVVQDPISRN